jgi:hypothetical protein
MSKIIVSLAFSMLVFISSYGQFNDAGAKCITFGINGLSNFSVTPSVGHGGTLLFKYFAKEDFAYRFLASAVISNSYSVSDNGTGTKNTSSNSNNTFGAGFGIQKTIAEFGKFNTYIGADIAANYSYSRTSNRTDYYQTQTSADAGDYRETITLRPAPISVGVYPLIGISYFFTKNFSAGLEYSPLISYSFPANGNTTTNQRSFGIDMAQISVNNSTSNAVNISTAGTALIDIAFYFGGAKDLMQQQWLPQK